MSYYRTQLEQYLATLDIKANVLYDIGGKQGNVKSRVKSWDVKNYRVLDLPEYNLNDSWRFMYDDLEKSADVVFCLETFEYLLDPLTAMGNIAYVMKKGAIAYISAPLIYPTHNELDWDSLRYTEQGLKRLAAFHDLTVNNVHYRVDKSGYLNKLYQSDGMKAAKQYSHHNATGFIMRFQK